MGKYKTFVCLGCNTRKPDIEFPEHKNYRTKPDGTKEVYNVKRRKCHNCMNREQQERLLKTHGTKEAVLDHRWEITFKSRAKTFNLTPEQARGMLEDQGGCCAICLNEIFFDRKVERKKRACIDHCHETLKVRGILCPTCNSSLGKLNDDIETLKRAIDYLQ